MDESQVWNRRGFLAALALLAAPRLALSDEEAEEKDLAGVRELAKRAGISGLQVSRNDHYLAIGDAPDAFRDQAIKILDGLMVDYLKHFSDKGFQVKKPSGRLTVVILADDVEFAAFLNEAPGDAAGIFDLETNRLLMFDNRAASRKNPNAQKVNTFVLFHEATHQLTFNTGLLDRAADVPLAVSEGLATYAETRHLKGPGKIGDVNVERKKVLTARRRSSPKAPLIPLAEFLVDDERFNDPDQFQMAYAQAWLLIHYLMKTPKRTEQFRDYLATIKERRKADRRLEDWKAAFGELEAMDRDLIAHSKK